MLTEFDKMLDHYFVLEKLIHNYFGYVEDRVVIPIDDSRAYYWRYPKGGDEVIFARTSNIQELIDSDGEYYSNLIYRQRFLPKWIYRGEDYTMFVVDTQTGGNKFLQIFDNSRELEAQ
jgi:hypothetical protein